GCQSPPFVAGDPFAVLAEQVEKQCGVLAVVEHGKDTEISFDVAACPLFGARLRVPGSSLASHVEKAAVGVVPSTDCTVPDALSASQDLCFATTIVDSNLAALTLLTAATLYTPPVSVPEADTWF